MAERISADQARKRVQSGKALLVCGYDDEQKCRGFNVENAITYKQFLSRLPNLPKNEEIIFF